MNTVKYCSLFLPAALLMAALSLPAYAASTQDTAAAAETSVSETQEEDTTSSKAIAMCVTIAVAAGAGAIAMGLVGSKTVEGISRQPEVESKLRTTLMLSLVFIETAIIYGLLVVILILFVL